MLNVEPAANRT